MATLLKYRARKPLLPEARVSVGYSNMITEGPRIQISVVTSWESTDPAQHFSLRLTVEEAQYVRSQIDHYLKGKV